MSIRFITSEECPSIPKTWSSRWDTLQNLVDEFPEQDLIEVPYTYGSLDELKEWIKLNKSMDKPSVLSAIDSDQSMDESTVTCDVSSVWKVIDFMCPASIEWLKYCNIDVHLKDEVRKELYHDLGRIVREEGVLHSYQKSEQRNLVVDRDHHRLVHQHLFEDIDGGVPEFFRLYDDPIYHTDKKKNIDEYNRLLSLRDINILTGIYHNAYRQGLVAGQLIPWTEIILFVSTWNMLHHVRGIGCNFIDMESLTTKPTQNQLPWLMADMEPPISNTDDIPLYLYVKTDKSVIYADFTSDIMNKVFSYIERIIPRYTDRLVDLLKLDEILESNPNYGLVCPKVYKSYTNIIEALGRYNIQLASGEHGKKLQITEFCSNIHTVIGRRGLEVYVKIVEKWNELIELRGRRSGYVSREFITISQQYLTQNE